MHAAAAARDQARQVAEHHLDRRLHRGALRQEPGGRRHGGCHRDRRFGALHRAPAQGGGVLAGDDPQRGQAVLLDPDHRRHRAGRDAGDGGIRGAVRHPPDRRHRAPARPDAGGRHRIHRQAGGLSRRRRLRHLLDVHAGRADRTRDEDPGGGARDRLRAVDRQFPHHDAAVVLRDHAAAAAVSRQRGRELQPRGGQPRALAVSALSGRHQPVRDSDRARRPCHLSVRRRRQRHVRTGAADRGEFPAAQHCRLRRRPVGRDRDGDRGMRRALHHGLQRHRPAAGAAAQPRDARRQQGFRRLPAQDPALCHLRHHGDGVFLLSRARQCAAGGDRPAVVRSARPAGAGLLRRPVLARGHRARRHDRHAGRLCGVGLYAVPAELPGRQSPPACCCCSTDRSASRRCVRGHCSAPICRR